MVVVDGRDGRAKITELAVTRDPRRPPPPGYAPYLPFCLAPEQLRGERPEPKSDVYALGAVLYELLSGSPPFEGHSWSELSQEIQAGDPEPPSDLVAGIPRAIERACLEALSLAPSARPSAGELAQRLRRAAGGEDDGAASPLVAAGLALALAAAAGAGVWGAWERRGRVDAEEQLGAARSELEVVRRELVEAKEAGAAREAQLQAELQAERDRAASRQKEHESALSLARAEVARAKTDAEGLRRTYEQRLTATALAAAKGGAQLGPLVDAFIAELEAAADLAPLRARLLLQRGRLDEAKALLRAEREKGPLPPALAFLELACQPEKARADELLAQLAALEEDSPYGAIGRVYTRQLDQNAAIQLLNRAYQKVPDNPDLLALLADLVGRAAMQSGNGQLMQQALYLSEQTVRRDPASVDARVDRARLLLHAYQLTQGRQPEFASQAAAELAAARALSDVPLLWNEAAKVHMVQGLHELATAVLEEGHQRAKAANDSNEAARALLLIGVVKLLARDERAAVQIWLEVLRTYPGAQATFEIAPYLRNLAPEHRNAVLQAVPPAMRAQLEAFMRQLPQGGR